MTMEGAEVNNKNYTISLQHTLYIHALTMLVQMGVMQCKLKLDTLKKSHTQELHQDFSAFAWHLFYGRC